MRGIMDEQARKTQLTDRAQGERGQPDLARRSLLKAAPLGALAIAAAGTARADQARARPVPQQSAARGYRETEHVRRYYATAAYW
jgi:hypothetical protein